MHSSRPYLTRALYQWLLDNDNTPYIVVDAEQPGVIVPTQFIQNGQIVLNIAPGAVRDLFMENDMIAFNARFGGQPMQVEVPIDALIAIYSRENGVGMVFGHEPVMPDAEQGAELDDREETSARLEGVEKNSAADDEPIDGNEQEERPSKGRPSLRVIK